MGTFTAGGGGSGEVTLLNPVTVTPGDSITVTIGAGGNKNGYIYTSAGADGGATSFGDLLSVAGGCGGDWGWGGCGGGANGAARTLGAGTSGSTSGYRTGGSSGGAGIFGGNGGSMNGNSGGSFVYYNHRNPWTYQYTYWYYGGGGAGGYGGEGTNAQSGGSNSASAAANSGAGTGAAIYPGLVGIGGSGKLIVYWNEPVESIKPTTIIELSGASGNNGYFTSNVQVTLTATDNVGGSGVAKTEYSLDNGVNWILYLNPFTISDEGTTISYRSIDYAGNIEQTKTQTVKIDKTLPQITINTPVDGSEYFLNQPLTADWSVNDAISGIASATGTYPSGSAINTASVGTQAFSVDATDNAGNTNTKKITYYIRYKYSGILQPINADGSSIFKLGSTVSVKFQLWDSSGNFITNAVAKIYTAKISDGVIGTELEANSTSNATTGNLFRYDSASNQYIFNLVTKTLSTGTWQIRIELDDGTAKTATIGLK